MSLRERQCLNWVTKTHRKPGGAGLSFSVAMGHLQIAVAAHFRQIDR